MSSAAAPAPPPHRYPLSGSSNGSSAGGSSSSRDGPGRPARALPHVKDLIAKGDETINRYRYGSTERLIDVADGSLRQALFHLELNRPDTAYVDFVVAYEIISEVLPHHKDASAISNRPNLLDKSKVLQRQLNAEEDRFRQVRDMIKADNSRNGTQPTHDADLAARIKGFSQQLQDPADARPASLQSPPSYKPTAQSQQYTQRYSYPASPSQERPSQQPTSSQSFSQRTTSRSQANDISQDRLNDRFAKLRTSSGSQPNKLPRHSVDYPSRRDAPSLHMSADPAAPAKEQRRAAPSINTSVASSLPKQPSPAYTPTRGAQDGARFQPTRSARTNGQQSYERPPSQASAVSSAGALSRATTQQTFYEDDEESGTTSSRPVQRRRRSVHKPQETDLSAQKLYDYLTQFNVLVIDVRPRSDFDSGHIFCRSIICIEPTALRPNMSAEDLQEALILSPEKEQSLFDRRNEFDLVVYYDQNSTAADFGPHRQRRPNAALSYLNDALLDYNQEKPLMWPPIILNGGVDAWEDLLGSQNLVVSETQSRLNRQPLQRRPAPDPTQRLDIGKRRHREYNPLDQEELKKWRERARSASVMLDERPQVDETTPHENGDDGIVTMLDYEDFAQRFPDVASVEQQQSATSQSIPSRIPQYPTTQPPTAPPPAPPPHTTPQPQIPPAIPARPPPAVPRRTYSGVGDRLPQTAAPARPPKLAEYIPPRFKRLPTTGLHNFGVTCYMNATIQCMSATVPLTSYLMETPKVKEQFETQNWKGTAGVLAELYWILLRNLWESTDADTIRPTNFRKYCARLNSEWGSDRQQDAKEFLEFLVDSLHEDLNHSWRRHPLKALTDQDEAHREQMPPWVAAKIEWSRALHRDYSKLTDIFAGQHMSQLRCTVCKHSSTTWEPFYSISVEIPNGKHINIYDCLSSYCSSEMLSGDEVWRCPHCKCEREATKRITITRVPETLVIHFKRFSASHSQSAKKITAPIDFPLDGLDISPCVLPQPDARQSEYIQNKHGSKELDMPGSMKPPYRYNCYAVMRHLGGTIASGHYIAMVKDDARQCWRKFDDSRVTDFKPEKLSKSDRLQNEQAYILFYKRTDGADGARW